MRGLKVSGKRVKKISEYFKTCTTKLVKNSVFICSIPFQKIKHLTLVRKPRENCLNLKREKIHYKSFYPAITTATSRFLQLNILVRFLIFTLFFVFTNLPLVFSSEVNTAYLADSIRIAEGVNSRKPYGILRDYCSDKNSKSIAQCRKGCIQTIEKWKKKLTYSDYRDFIRQFGSIYCPLSDKRDKKGLNKNWVRNVTLLYQKRESEASNGVSNRKEMLSRQERDYAPVPSVG